MFFSLILKEINKELIRTIIQIQTCHQPPSSASTHQGFQLKKSLQFPFKNQKADTGADQECRHISSPRGWGSMLSRLQSNSHCADRQHSYNWCGGNYQPEKQGCKHHHWAANVQNYYPSWWWKGFSQREFKGSCPIQALRQSCVCRLSSCRWPPLSEISATSARSCPGSRITKCPHPSPSTDIAEEGGRPGGRSLGFSPWLSGIHGSISAWKQESK